MKILNGTIHRIFYVEDDKLYMKEFLDGSTAWEEAREFLETIKRCPIVEFWKIEGSSHEWVRSLQWNAHIVNEYLERRD